MAELEENYLTVALETENHEELSHSVIFASRTLIQQEADESLTGIASHIGLIFASNLTGAIWQILTPIAYTASSKGETWPDGRHYPITSLTIPDQFTGCPWSLSTESLISCTPTHAR